MNKNIQFMLDKANPDDIWKYKGMTLFVVKMNFQLPSDWAKFGPEYEYVIKDGVYYGFVITGINVPAPELHKIPVHEEGITFWLHGDDENLYGFHTIPKEDYDDRKTKGWAIDETARLADSLLEWAKQHE